jgi:hypothetical protein
MLPVVVHCLLTGLYNSAVVRPMFSVWALRAPSQSKPPTTRTRPSGSNVVA